MRVNWSIPVNHRDYNKMPASVWIRCLQLLPYLNEYCVHSVINDTAGDSEIEIFVRQIDADACARMRRAKEEGKKIIFDLCVNYFDPVGVSAAGYGTTPGQRDQVLRMLELSEVILCASEYIAKRASEFHPRAICLPDSIDRQHFSHRKPLEDFNKDPLTFVYSGVAIKTDYLFEEIYPLLKKAGFRLLVITDHRPHLLRKYKYCQWKYKTFPHTLLSGEVGLAPRQVDSPYELGHSLFKIGVFLAQGIPVLASPVPSYSKVLGEDRGGLICSTTGEWKAALQNINQDRGLLRKFSANGSKLMEPYYTENIARRYYQIFCELLGREA